MPDYTLHIDVTIVDVACPAMLEKIKSSASEPRDLGRAEMKAEVLAASSSNDIIISGNKYCDFWSLTPRGVTITRKHL